MLQTIIKATENFCINQLSASCSVEDEIGDMRTLIAYIDITAQNDKSYRVYLASTKSFTQRVSKLFLEEDESDEEALVDMALETANLIVGSAKVVAQETENSSFTIGTPLFEKIGSFDFEYDEAKTIKIEDDEMIVAMKEL